MLERPIDYQDSRIIDYNNGHSSGFEKGYRRGFAMGMKPGFDAGYNAPGQAENFSPVNIPNVNSPEFEGLGAAFNNGFSEGFESGYLASYGLSYIRYYEIGRKQKATDLKSLIENAKNREPDFKRKRGKGMKQRERSWKNETVKTIAEMFGQNLNGILDDPNQRQIIISRLRESIRGEIEQFFQDTDPDDILPNFIKSA